MTKLEIANKLLQWFGIRIARCKKEVVLLDYTLHESPDHSFRVFITETQTAIKKHQVWYAINGWIPPFSDRKESNWSLRVSKIKETKNESMKQEEWIAYIEKIKCGYDGYKVDLEKDHYCIDIDMITSYGKLIDEQKIDN